MRKICWCLLIGLLLTLIACADHSAAGISEKAAAKRESAMEAYKKVLRNERGFFDVLPGENGVRDKIAKESVCLKEYYSLNYENIMKEFSVDHLAAWIQFAVVDMDGDSIPEVILNIPRLDEREVLHYENGRVYGYSFGYRETKGIKKDGVFGWSGGGGYNGCGKLAFSEGTCEIICIAKYNSGSNPPETAIYRINDAEVTEEEYEAFFAVQHEKEEVEWHQLAEENINKYVHP